MQNVNVSTLLRGCLFSFWMAVTSPVWLPGAWLLLNLTAGQKLGMLWGVAAGTIFLEVAMFLALTWLTQISTCYLIGQRKGVPNAVALTLQYVFRPLTRLPLLNSWSVSREEKAASAVAAVEPDKNESHGASEAPALSASSPKPANNLAVEPLEPPAIHYLHAAEGWMGLGDHVSAQEELEHIPLLLRAHPDVIQVKWEICAARHDWSLALEMARTLTKLAPDRRLGWVRLAQSLHHLGRTGEATEQLLSVINSFGQNSVLPYHLARFYCALSRPAQARAWLERALHVAQNNGEMELLRKRVSDDPHLERIWKEMEIL